MVKIKRKLRLVINTLIISHVICLSLLNAEGITKSLAVRSAQQAVEKAITITKFREKSSEPNNVETKQAELIVFNDSTTPFLGEYSSNHKVWQVKFEDVHLSKFPEDRGDRKFNRNFDVFIDSLSGNLLKITCQNGIVNPEECPPMDAKYAEEQIQGAGAQYWEFPAEKPKVDFKTALMSCPYNPLTAKIIVGQYVQLTSGNRLPKNIWMITLIGIPPLQPKGGKADWIPVYQRNRIRIAVSAENGKVLFATTNPGLPLTPEDKARLFPNLDE